MQTAQVIPFSFEANQVRTAIVEGEPWFAVKDIIRALDYSKASAPAKLVDAVPVQWKGVNPIHTPGGSQKLLMLSEQGLYFFLGRSDKPKALPFQMWLAGEVLPAIRKQGSYTDAHNALGTLIGETIGTNGFNMLGALIKGKVAALPAALQRKATAKIWSQTHAAFGVRSAADIPASQLDAARNFVAAYALEGEWLPAPGATLSEADWQNLNALVVHMQWLRSIYSEYGLFNHFAQVGSPVGAKLHDHVVGGAAVAMALQGQHSARLRLVSSR